MSNSHPKAVIDLGTNTFHLLIYKLEGGVLTTIFRQRKFVKLAEEGIDNIGNAAITRALDAMASFRKLMSAHQVGSHLAVGTAALRTASNAGWLLQQIWSLHQIRVDVISGEDEAGLIAVGVANAMQMQEETALIMDIGGGSVEFIFLKNGHAVSLASLPIGVAVMFQKFPQNDPIDKASEQSLRSFIQVQLEKIVSTLDLYKPGTLIGASGTFDVLADILDFPASVYHQVAQQQLIDPLDAIVHSSLGDRKANSQIPDDRIDMIVVACILIQEVLQMGRFNQVGISKYALKEGLALTSNDALKSKF